MAEKPLELSRYCIPFTPFTKAMDQATIALVSTAGVRMRSDPPFQVEGDSSYRLITAGTTAELTYDDTHYDHACVDQDLNCLFPLDRLRELAAEKVIGAVADKHYSLGFSPALRELRESTIPSLVREVERSRPDAVLLTGG
jgi:hypothetical protein